MHTSVCDCRRVHQTISPDPLFIDPGRGHSIVSQHPAPRPVPNRRSAHGLAYPVFTVARYAVLQHDIRMHGHILVSTGARAALLDRLLEPPEGLTRLQPRLRGYTIVMMHGNPGPGGPLRMQLARYRGAGASGA